MKTRFVLTPIWILFGVITFSACNKSANSDSASTEADSIMFATDPRFEGNRQMVHLLDSLAETANPELNYFLSGKRATKIFNNPPHSQNPAEIIMWEWKYCFELLNAGNTSVCIQTLNEMLAKYPNGRAAAMKDPEFLKVFDLLAVAYLRQGENDNCVANHNNYSCIVPLQKEAFHKATEGSTQAIKIYQEILKQYPTDYQSKWLLNIAYMTLGQYPNEVPKEYLIDFDKLDEKVANFSPFRNVATDLSVDIDGLSGGAIIEDFNNDGLQDIFCSSYGLYDQMHLFLADGNGGYVDKTNASMLKGLKGGLNAKQADFNNDGNMDILVLRGAWLDKGGEWPNSLLKNNGDGTFSDITIAAGMMNFRPTETATWGDVNNDGYLDVFIANENNTTNQYPCELYVNNGNEKFVDVAKDWGVDGNFGYAKAAIFADMNNDGLQDLFVSSIRGKNHLFMNRGISKDAQGNDKVSFEDIASKVGIEMPFMSFPAAIFDFNHDGFQDILVTSFPLDHLSQVAGLACMENLGEKLPVETTKLYLNLGDEKFKDISKQANINKMIFAMGLNYGDFNNDGYIDFYAGTGAFEFSSLVPNRAFINMNGTRFAEVTHTSGLGHLQKGHGIAFGDLDNDGDQDIYTTLGGAVEGDNAHNALFVNPNAGNNWLTLKLFGKSVAKDAQGTRVMVKTNGPDGAKVFYHTVSSGASFGANSLQLEMGIGKANVITEVEIWWGGLPKKKQIYQSLAINQHYKLVEGNVIAEKLKLSPKPLKGEGGSKSCCKK